MPDLIANQTLRNNQFLQAKSSGGVDLNLMGMGSGNDLTIGASSNVNYNSILLNPGVATNPFQILRSTGQLQCGGPTRRVIISETGLTVGRTFTFPDVNAKLVGEGAAITEGANIVLGTTTGSKIGTATNQKLGFYNATPIVQGASITDISTAATGTEISVAVNALISRLEAMGLIATV